MIQLKVISETTRYSSPWQERIEQLRQAVRGAYDCVAAYGKVGLVSLDNVKRLVEDVALSLNNQHDSFIVSGNEPFRVDVRTAGNNVIAYVYPGAEIDPDQDPVFAFDGAEGNNKSVVFSDGKTFPLDSEE